MGCNLCTLQKREEHYKLLYEIAQVNGRELSKAGHEEALDVFRSAKDPIVVQVLRRSPIHKARGPHEVPLVDVCTQTDITFEHIMALAKLRPTTPPVPDTCPFLLSDSCHSLHTMEREYYDSPEYLPNLQADGERADSFEYEEVELCRMNSQEKLGLTLCYRTDDDEDVAIYVSEVGPNSIAARDGRIREGDRILQINGQDVQDREEAVALLSSEDSWSILLLVARPETQLEEGWLDEEHNEFLEELKLEMLKEKQREEIQQAVESMKQFIKPKDDDITTDTATCSSNNQDKDSGVGRTDDSMRHGESSEQEVLAQLKHKFSRCLPDGVERGHAHCESLPLERFPEEEEEERQEEDEEEGGQDHFQQLLELKCQISNGGEYGLYYSRRSTIECSLTEPAGVERELRLLNEELRSIELECQTIMQAHQLRKAREAHLGEQPERSDKDSSSAYNTAESCRSTPERPLPRRVSLANQKNLRSTLVANRLGFKPPRSVAGSYCHGDESQAVSSSCSDMGNSSMLPAGSNSCHGDKARKLVNVIESLPGNGNESRLISNVNCRPNPTDHQGAEQSQEGSRLPYLPPYDAISTHTHQYQSYMHLVQQRSAVEFGLTGVEPKMEWKVKIRSDGTRYITKRPARDRILRERALKIREERCGTTTDDDAMSELKTGRYWSKEERKQQLARAREQRRRREFMQRSRLESLREAPQSGGEGRREVSIIELSHRKMMKKRNKKILDNWMTIQELMTHGAKAAEGAKVHNAFLSVTTV